MSGAVSVASSSVALSSRSQSHTATAPATGTVAAPRERPFTYHDFAAKMKLPAAQEIVRTLKAYVKVVQSAEWIKRFPSAADATEATTTTDSTTDIAPAAPDAAYDRDFHLIKSEYNSLITSVFSSLRSSSAWHGCSSGELENGLEGVEKFLTSKLYDRLLGLFASDRERDHRLTERLFVLHTWVEPRHLDLPEAACGVDALGGWEAAAEELRAIDRFKSPRDKLVCMLNACNTINSILKRAKMKANSDRERAAEALISQEAQRVRADMDAAQQQQRDGENPNPNPVESGTASTAAADSSSKTPIVAPAATTSSLPLVPLRDALVDDGAGGVVGSAGGGGFVPSSSPSADDFFPALLFTLIRARPSRLALHLAFISLCRVEPKLHVGETAYWYTALASAVHFLLDADERSFTFDRRDRDTTNTTSPSTSTTTADDKDGTTITTIATTTEEVDADTTEIDAHAEFTRRMAAGQRKWEEHQQEEEEQAKKESAGEFEDVAATSHLAVPSSSSPSITTESTPFPSPPIAPTPADATSTVPECALVDDFACAATATSTTTAAIDADAAESQNDAISNSSVLPSAPPISPTNAEAEPHTPNTAGTSPSPSAPSSASASSSSPSPSPSAPIPSLPSAAPSPTASGVPPAPSCLCEIHNHGAASWTVSSSGSSESINVAPIPLPPPCVACLHLSHRRVPTRFLQREFTSLTIGELQDVLGEYKELCFLLQGWQEAALHRGLKEMQLPARVLPSPDDTDGLTLTGDDAIAAESNAVVANLPVPVAVVPPPPVTGVAAAVAAAAARGWPLVNLLGALGRGATRATTRTTPP